jgi:hypothetical protein
MSARVRAYASGRLLEGNDRQAEAMAGFAEGVLMLALYFQALPEAYAPLMDRLVGEYQRLAESLGHRLDTALLAPVLEALERLPKLATSGGEAAPQQGPRPAFTARRWRGSSVGNGWWSRST